MIGLGVGLGNALGSGGGNSPAFAQRGPTLDLVFGAPITDPLNAGQREDFSLDLRFLVQTYQVAAQYLVWENAGMSAKTFGDIVTFTRASSGSYYDASTVALAEQNLLLRSQEFDNAAWEKGTGASVVSNNATAPDGTSTADTLTVTGGGATNSLEFVRQYLGLAAGVTYTFSVHARSVSGSTSMILDAQNNESSTQTITSSWARYTWTFTPAAARTWIDLQMGAAATVELWGAQLEQRSTVTAYTPTTTAAITNYIPQLMTAATNVPRIDYDPVTRAIRGLLVEEARTNFIRWSQDFSVTNWTKVGITLTPASFVAPDGSVTGSVVTMTASGYVLQSTTAVNGANASASASIYIKNVNCTSSDTLTINLSDGVVGTIGMTFKPFDGSFTPFTSNSWSSVSRSATNVGNGWWRITLSGTTTQWTSGWLEIVSGNSGRAFAIWGAQIEAGLFPTSYIPTTSAAVTRAADVANVNTLSPWFNAAEGTLFAEGSALALLQGADKVIASLTAGTAANTFEPYKPASTSDAALYMAAGSSAQAVLTIASIFNPGAVCKVAAAFKENDVAMSANGSAVQTDASAIVPTVSRLGIGGRGDGASGAIWCGHIRRVLYYPRRLSNAELQALTA